VRTTEDDLVLDREQLRSVTLDDPKLMREILLALIEDAGHQSGLIGAAFAEGDSQRAIRLARNSARACDNVGASRTAGVLRSLERAAAAADVASGTAALASLAAEIDRLRAEASQL
jgi:HPt (histidine-containing phosphotransfer) domain-containing protein